MTSRAGFSGPNLSTGRRPQGRSALGRLAGSATPAGRGLDSSMLLSGDGSNEEGDSTTAAQTNQLSENVQTPTEGDAVVASIAANPGLGAFTTRVTRVARREGLPPLHLQPCAPAPTQAQQADRIVALRNQIRYTFAIQPHILQRHLRNNNWNVIEAADAFWEEEEAARSSNVLPQDYEIPMGRSVETSRLRARTALRRRLNTSSRDTNSTPLTNSAIFGLLQRNHWVLSDAEEDYHAKKGNIDDIIDAYSSLRAPRPSLVEEDARLASFLSLTSTNSIYAARRHLQQHGWDYARAVDGWRRMRALPEDRAPKLINTKGFVHETQPNDGLRYNNANHPPYPYSYWREALDVPDDDDSSGPPSSTDGASDSSLSEIEDDSDDMDKPTCEKSERNGYLIEYDPKPAVLNCPEPSKLRVEMIRKRDYKMVIFKGHEGRHRNSTEPNRRFRWHDEEREDGEVYVEFDWSNPDHIRQLNKWRQQFHRRQAPDTITPQVMQYHPLEEEYLWQKHAEHVEEEVGKGRIDPTDGSSLPLMVTRARKREWADALNKRFAGKTDVNGVHLSDEPRPLRHFTSVDSARYRMQSIVRDFGVGLAQRRGVRQGLGKKYHTGKRLRAIRFESRSNEDDEDDIGESSGTNEGNYDRSSDSGAEAGAGKRKKHNRDNGRAEDRRKLAQLNVNPVMAA